MEESKRHFNLESVFVIHVEETGERDQLVRVIDARMGKCQLIAKNSRSSKRFGESLIPGNLISAKVDRFNDYFGVMLEGEILQSKKSKNYQDLIGKMKVLHRLDKELLLGGGQEVYELLKNSSDEDFISQNFWKKYHVLMGNS